MVTNLSALEYPMQRVFLGRILGAIVLTQLGLGILFNAVLTAPLFAEGGYLLHAAPAGLQLGMAVLVGLVGMVLALALAVLAWPVLAAHSPAMARVFLALTVVGMALSGVEQAGVLAMRDFSDSYMAAEGEQQALLASLSATGALLRNGVHYIALMVAGMTLGVWYFCLLRFALLPWVLAALGLVACALQLYAIAQPILGGVVPFVLLAPLALAQLLMGGWLLAFGFRDSPPADPAA